MTTRETTGVPFLIKKQLGEAHGHPLTAREAEVITAVLAGHVTRGGIAEALGIAERTVHTHMENIYAKTGAINLTDLVLMALGRKEAPDNLREYVF